VYDNPNSPFVFGFVGQSNCLQVKITGGEIWFEDRPLGLKAEGQPDGEAQLYFRPHDIELRDGCGGCIAGLLTSSRRVAGTRHIEVNIGRDHPPIEIELPPMQADGLDRNRIAFRPTRWKLFRSA
jgi:sulfate transport system ATP-binding protein